MNPRIKSGLLELLKDVVIMGTGFSIAYGAISAIKNPENDSMVANKMISGAIVGVCAGVLYSTTNQIFRYIRRKKDN